MGTNVKLSCSLKWLCRILSESFFLEELEERRLLSKGAIQKMFLEPYSHGRLKKETIDLLTDPSIYLNAYLTIYSGGKVEEDSFECLIHNLAKKGGYVLEDNDIVVNGSMLAQKVPFREASHLALLDVLMVQYASKIVTVQRTVKAARRIFSFNPSKELPSKPDVELLLITWLNKVAQAVSDEQYTRRRRRRRKGVLTVTGDLCCALKDGRNLALLLVYYDPESFSWNDFDLDSDSPLPERKVLKNIQAVFDYCNTQFAPHSFHIAPIDFFQWVESGLLRCNILAFLAHLFYSLEIMQAVSSLRVPSISKHMNSQMNISHSASESSIRKRKEWLEPAGRRSHHIKMDHSQITKESDTASKLTLPDVKNIHQEIVVDSNFTRFRPPIRSSVNPVQTSILARFKKERGLSGELIHSQSFPFAARSLTSAVHSSSSLGDPMLHSSKKVKAGSLEVVQRLSPSGDLLASNSLVDDRESFRHEGARKSSSTVETSGEDAADSHVSSSGSFTVHKRHTFSSATAAGLPVVDRNFSCTSEKRRTIFQQQSADQPKTDDHKNTILLHNFLELHHSHSQENMGCEYSPVVELAIPLNAQKLRQKLIPIFSSLNSKEDTVEAKVMVELCRVFSKQPCENNETSVNFNLTTFPSKDDKDGSNNAAVKTEGMSLENENTCSTHKNKQPQLNPASESPLGYRRITASLEQFERDELLVLQQVTPVSMSEQSDSGQRTSSTRDHSRLPLEGQISSSHFDSQKPLASNSVRSCNGFTCDSQGAACNSSDEVPASHGSSDDGVSTNGAAGTGGEECAARTSTAYRSTEGRLSPRGCGRFTGSGSGLEHKNGRKAPEGDGRIGSNRCTQVKNCTDSNSGSQVHLTNGDRRFNAGSGVGGDGPALSIDCGGNVSSTDKVHHRGPCANEGCEMGTDSGATGDNVAVPNDVAAKPSNPWVPPLHQVVTTPLQKRKEKRFRQLLDERDHARKLAVENRKTERRDDAQSDEGDAQVKSKSTTFFEYTGPNCYIKPKAKTNLQIVRNAICSVCLAGEVDNPLKQNVLKVLEQTTATHVLVLFRDRVGFKFRGIYSYYPGERHISRICGTGPREIKDTMIGALYKYNSGQKDFKEIPSQSFSVSVDGLTIKNECWHNAKRKSSAKSQLL